MSWKTITNLSGNKFPFIEYCQVEPLLEPLEQHTYQAWGDYLIYELKSRQTVEVYTRLGNELTADHESIGRFCDWITETYWGKME